MSTKKMAVDNDSAWNSSKGECEFDMLSIIRENLNNIKYTGHTCTHINYYKLNDSDAELLEMYDNGSGFENTKSVEQALTISATRGEGNNNFGVGMKAPMLLEGKVGIIFYIASNLQYVKSFKFGKTGLPDELDITPEITNLLLDKYEGQTAIVVLYGTDYADSRRNKFSLTIDDVKRDIINKEQFEMCEPIEGKKLSHVFSTCYSDKIKQGDTIIYNLEVVQAEDIFTVERADGIQVDKDTYRPYLVKAELTTLKNNEYYVKVYNNEELVEEGYINKKTNSLKFTKVSKKYEKSDIVNVSNLTIMHGKKGESEGEGGIPIERGLYIKSDGICISTTHIPDIQDNPHMRCLLEETLFNGVSYINRKRNKSHTQLVRDETLKKNIVKLIKHSNVITGRYKSEGVKYNESLKLNEQENRDQETHEQENREQENHEQENHVQGIDSVDSNEPDNKRQPVKKKSNRANKEFTDSVKKQALDRQKYCPLTGQSHRMNGASQNYDHDHKIEIKDGGTGRLENCQVLSVAAHRIKTYDGTLYGELMKSEESIKQHRYENIIDIIQNSKKAGLRFSEKEQNSLIKLICT